MLSRRITAAVFLSLFACGPSPSNAVTPAKTIGGAVSPNVTQVAILGVSGKTTIVKVQGGAFNAPLPAEPFSVVFYGTNHRVLANLAAKPSANSNKLKAVFPAPRVATSAGGLEGVQQQALLSGSDLQLGTITVTTTITVTAQYNLFDDLDTDGDGQSDFEDSDDDGDGIGDEQEASSLLDIDGDGALSLLDDDDDGDGTPDATDTDDDNDGVLDTAQADEDGDGIPDATDLDDDGDGIDDTADAADATPDILVGNWHGTTQVTDFSFATGRPVAMDELFVLSDDGSMTGTFDATDAASGCHVEYDLVGTWADAPDSVDHLEVTWTSVKAQITSCTDSSLNTNGIEDLTADEKDLWDDELDGTWFIDANQLTIVGPTGQIVADYERAQ